MISKEEADLNYVTISIFLLLLASAQAAVVEVRPGQSIQAAINSANPGDTVNVLRGIYYEHIDVLKPLMLSGIGNGGGRPVIDAGGFGSAVTISYDYGIRMDGTYGNTIQGNILTGSSYYDAYDSGTDYWGLNGYGNYYSHFHLPEQGCWDTNGDGICDRWYDIPGGSNVDWSPIRDSQYGSYDYGYGPQYSYSSTTALSSSISVS